MHFWCWVEVLCISGVGQKSCTFLVFGPRSSVHFWCFVEVLCISGVGWKLCAFLMLGGSHMHF